MGRKAHVVIDQTDEGWIVAADGDDRVNVTTAGDSIRVEVVPADGDGPKATPLDVSLGGAPATS